MQLFYHPTLKPNDLQVIFDKDESKHMIKVLRKKEGDLLDIFNGNGVFFKAEIIYTSANQCIAKINSIIEEKKPTYFLHLAVAPTKLNERYEWFLEKSTEIGIDEITPILCKHSERKKINAERFEKIIVNAAKQSIKSYLPKLNAASDFETFINKLANTNTKKYIAHCAQGVKKSIKDALKPNENTVILIGPEGDFSTSEIDFALKNGFTAIHLGNSRLRTETAAIVACHSVRFINE